MTSSTKQKVAVLGAGSWGTALAVHLVRAGHQVCLWGIEQAVLADIAAGENKKYQPGARFSHCPETSLDFETAVRDAALVVFAVPSGAFREVASKLAKHFSGQLVISVAKGLEEGSEKRLSEVLKEVLPQAAVGVLSGPSFAREVLEKRPTAVTVAAADLGNAKRMASFFHYEYLRIYTSTDIAGVEYAGALKNVLALAIGVADGMEMGLNARAALITRGLAELGRFIEQLGGKRETVTGLSGLGDLLLTATGDLSRNRQVGMRLGKGENLNGILSDIGQVAEGVKTARVAEKLAKRFGIEAPIVSETNKILDGTQSAKDAVFSLLSRAQKNE